MSRSAPLHGLKGRPESGVPLRAGADLSDLLNQDRLYRPPSAQAAFPALSGYGIPAIYTLHS